VPKARQMKAWHERYEPTRYVHLIASLFPLDQPSIGLKFAGADEHLVLIRD
jgi:hypothetical protein